MDSNKDEEILLAIKTGQNGIVLNHLYKTALPQITKFVVRNGGDTDEAKDIFQDAVLSLFNTVKLKKYENGRDLKGFLYFVSRNLWINRIKKRNKQFSIVDTDSFEMEDTPYAKIITQEKETAILDLMEKIGTQCKELLKYTLYDKLSLKEVAQKMGFASEDVAKTAQYRCKQKLSTLIRSDKTIVTLFRD